MMNQYTKDQQCGLLLKETDCRALEHEEREIDQIYQCPELGIFDYSIPNNNKRLDRSILYLCQFHMEWHEGLNQ